MDYERKYKEALKKAKSIRSLLKDSDDDKNFSYAETIEDIFPELKETEDERIKKSLIGHLRECRNQCRSEVMIGEYAKWIAWLEKQGEQNPADKVEPKFKVGDWIVRRDGETFYNRSKFAQITKIDKDEERCWFDCGSWLEAKDIKIWTIQDAKDGDILAYNNSIIIFRKFKNRRWDDVIDFYINYNCIYDKISIKSNDSHYGVISKTLFKPATKEQRDLLFSKMKEAGYEWDAEKKELKNIKEQNPTEDDCKISDCVEKVDMTEYNKGFECGKQRVLKYPEEFNLCEKSASTWSEEDEKMFRDSCCYLNEYGNWLSDKNEEKSLSIYRAYDWLKSLRERIKGE